MSEVQKINSELASHNIASVFSELFIRGLDNPRILSPDSTEINTAAKKAAQLYAIAYDEAYNTFSNENKEITDDTE